MASAVRACGTVMFVAVLLAGCADPAAHVPPFARRPYEPFSRGAAIAIARTEWRAFGAPVDDDPPGTRPPPDPDAKPERAAGLWQRVGEYWWLGLDAGAPEAAWTGKHDSAGRVFPADQDGRFAWSAAFISYVMRIAGAGARFPYAAAHAVYIRAAVQVAEGWTRRWAIVAEPPDRYPPQPGDLICTGRAGVVPRLAALPSRGFPAHCDIVVAAAPGMLDAIGGNVDDAVTLKHVSLTAAGLLADPRYPWFVVLRVLYDQ